MGKCAVSCKGQPRYSMGMTDKIAMEQSAGMRLALLQSSFERLTGGPLVTPGSDVWTAPVAVVAHGREDPPLFFYGNAQALALFRMDAAAFIGLPSYKSAEPAHRDERAALFARLQSCNVVNDYHGIRIAADGTRFRIENAVIWNLIDSSGHPRGQAAAFGRWTML